MAALETSLAAFNTEYLDLVLLHYAACFGSLCATEPQGTWRDSWRALEDSVREGRILAIGALLDVHLEGVSTEQYDCRIMQSMECRDTHSSAVGAVGVHETFL